MVAGALLVSVIVPSYNGAHLLPRCLDSLQRQTYPHLEVIVADGASSDTTRDVVSAYAGVRLLELRKNAGFTGNVNSGIRAARGEIVCLLNNDAYADADWISACVDAFARYPGAGSVASRVLFSDGGTMNSAGDELARDGTARQRGSGQSDGPAWQHEEPVFGAMGGAAAYRRAMLADVGLLDEAFFMYLEDVDLAFRAQLRGWSCMYVPSARVLHEGSATGGGALASFYNGRNLIRLWAKDLPAGLLPSMLPAIVRFQLRRAAAAARAWQGDAARATLRGQLRGIAELPLHLRARRAVQQRTRVSDADVYALLAS